VIDAIQRSRELTRQLAELGRGDDARAEPILLDNAVAAASDWLRAMPRQGQQVDVVPGAAGIRVRLDPTHLDQILMNLVGNALDATRAGCTVRVTTEVVTDDDGRDAVLTVRDDGVGIDADTRRRIFEPYFTTKRGAGTGLGLAIVHALAERAGGFIDVESAPGKGTVVTVHLPVAEE
jgi:signal transduction histidine kinase